MQSAPPVIHPGLHRPLRGILSLQTSTKVKLRRSTMNLNNKTQLSERTQMPPANSVCPHTQSRQPRCPDGETQTNVGSYTRQVLFEQLSGFGRPLPSA